MSHSVVQSQVPALSSNMCRTTKKTFRQFTNKMLIRTHGVIKDHPKTGIATVTQLFFKMAFTEKAKFQCKVLYLAFLAVFHYCVFYFCTLCRFTLPTIHFTSSVSPSCPETLKIKTNNPLPPVLMLVCRMILPKYNYSNSSNSS